MSNFNVLPRHATALVIGGRVYIIRRRAAKEELLNRDINPDQPCYSKINSNQEFQKKWYY